MRAGRSNVGNRVGAVCERSARVGGKLRRLKRELSINQRCFLTLLVLAGNPDFVGEAIKALRLLELRELCLAGFKGLFSRLLRTELFADNALHIVKRAFLFRVVLNNAGRNKRIALHFNRVRIALFLQAFRTKERFGNAVVDDAAELGIRHAVAGDEVSRLYLEAEFLSGGLERVGLFVNHVRELVGAFRERADRHLFGVFALDLGLHGFKGFDGPGLNVGHINDVVAEFRFHGTDDVALLGIEDGVFKGLRHHALAEERKVAALRGAARILRFLFSDSGELRGISLHFSKNPFGLLESRSLVVAELNENVACAALLRNGPAVLVLFVIGLDVVGIGLLILEVLGREDDVFGLDVLGREEFGQMSGVVSLHLII